MTSPNFMADSSTEIWFPGWIVSPDVLPPIRLILGLPAGHHLEFLVGELPGCCPCLVAKEVTDGDIEACCDSEG